MGKTNSELKSVEEPKTEEEHKITEIKKYINFQVEVVNNGFVVTIGCQKLVFTNLLEAADALKEYWNNPSKTEAKYLRNSFAFSHSVIDRTPTGILTSTPTYQDNN